MNATLWIRDPYPFRYEEYDALQVALGKTFGSSSLVYLREWPVDYVSIEHTTITTCKQIATTLKAIHLQQAILDKKYTGRVYCQELEIEIQKPGDNRPEWAIKKDKEQ